MRKVNDVVDCKAQVGIDNSGPCCAFFTESFLLLWSGDGSGEMVTRCKFRKDPVSSS